MKKNWLSLWLSVCPLVAGLAFADVNSGGKESVSGTKGSSGVNSRSSETSNPRKHHRRIQKDTGTERFPLHAPTPPGDNRGSMAGVGEG